MKRDFQLIDWSEPVSVAKAAEMLRVSPRRVRALLQAGRIPGAKRVGREWVIPLAFIVEPGTRGPQLGSKPRRVREAAG